MSDLVAPAVPEAVADARPRLVTWARVGIAVWAALGLALLFCGAMTRTVSYDEDQYIAAGVMTLHMMPYRDFAYLQAPLYPLVLAPFFAVAHGWYLLMGRLVSFGFATCSALLLWHLVRRLGAGVALAMVLLTACLTSPFLLAPLANTRNDGLPLTLMLAGLAVHLWAEERGNDRRPGRRTASPAAVFAARFGAALLFGLAAEAKVSYAFAPLALGLHALFAPRRRLLPAVLGGLVAALPAAFFYAVAPVQFLFGILQYHLTAPISWYTAAHMTDLLQPWTRLETLGEFATLGGNLTLVLLSVALALIAMARRRKWKRPGRMLITLTAGATVFALMPAPSWAMYFAAVAPLLACCIAHLNRTTTHLAGAERKRILLIVACLPIVPFLPLQLRELPKLLDRGQWVGVDAHRNAQKIRAAMAVGGAEGGDVATLFPVWVIDANPIESALATGPFVFRSGDGYDPGLLASLHALSPSMLGPLFDADPPAGIYAGRYAGNWPVPMDQPLIDYAERHHWTLVRTDEAGGRLWVRPKQ
jgi:hypothetical protein